MSNQSDKPSLYSWYALALLMSVYVLNFLDRSIIYILFPQIKQEMSFSYLQLSMLGATSFVIFYTVLGIPFGWLADKGSRTKMIAVGVAVWCIFSGLTAFAWDFWTLFLCRVMVGVGEATLGPAAISLLSDYFPPVRRATVTSIYSMGIAIGAGLAAILGGWLSQHGWRTAFMIVGFPGLVLAVLVLLMREPPKTVQTTVEEHYTGADWKRLLSNKTFVLLCLGYALLGLATNNISVWGTIYLNRIYGFEIPYIGYWTGILTLLAGIPATLFGGVMADSFRKRSKGGRLFYSSMLSLFSFLLWIVILFTDNFILIIPAAFILLFSALAWLGAAAADVTEIAGVNLRGLGIAIFYFSVNLTAFLLGANLIGILSDWLGGTDNPAMLRYALLVCPLSCLLSFVLLRLAAKNYNTGSAGISACP